MNNERAECQRLSGNFGLCIPVADLQSPPPELALNLHLGEYRPFYLVREEDELSRKNLEEQFGLLIIGRPLSGKTRMAFEAMLAVVPDGILLRFGGPQRLVNLDALVIPRRLVEGNEEKPSLAIFFDDLDKYDGAPFDELVDRLSPQVSKLYVVATCRSGATPRVLASESLKNLRASRLPPSRIVEIRPLTALQAIEIEREMWKTDPGHDLSVDRTEVGVILGGSKFLETSYERINEDGRRVLQGLFLAECFVSPCPSDLLRSIVERVVQIASFVLFERTLAALVDMDIILRDDLSRLSIASQQYRDQVRNAHYSLVSKLRLDLRLVEPVLEGKSGATHLAQLGIYYANQLADLPEARRVFEASLKLWWRAETLASLSLVLARSGEDEAAKITLEECLAMLPETNQQANLLIRLGDELLLKGRSSAAVPFYERARELAQEQPTKLAADFRFGDALLAENAFDRAEPIYRKMLEKAPDDAKHIAAARLVVSVIGQWQIERAAQNLLELLRGRPNAFRLLLAASLHEEGENRFLADDRLAMLRQLTWAAIRETSVRGSCRALVSDIAYFPFTAPPDWDFGLPVVYAVWGFVVVSLYPLCCWYAGVRCRHDWWWLNYL